MTTLQIRTSDDAFEEVLFVTISKASFALSIDSLNLPNCIFAIAVFPVQIEIISPSILGLDADIALAKADIALSNSPIRK